MGAVFFITTGQLLSAQNQAEVIRGRVTDEKHKPLAFADIVITNTLGALVTGKEINHIDKW